MVGKAIWLVWAAGGACSIASISVGDGRFQTWRAGLMLGAVALAGVVAFVHRFRMSSGVLKFDGQCWFFGNRSGRLQICLDLQSLMLLRFSSTGHEARWFWIEKSFGAEGFESWRAVRRAVYSRPSAASDDGVTVSANRSGRRSSFSP